MLAMWCKLVQCKFKLKSFQTVYAHLLGVKYFALLLRTPLINLYFYKFGTTCFVKDAEVVSQTFDWHLPEWGILWRECPPHVLCGGGRQPRQVALGHRGRLSQVRILVRISSTCAVWWGRQSCQVALGHRGRLSRVRILVRTSSTCAVWLRTPASSSGSGHWDRLSQARILLRISSTCDVMLRTRASSSGSWTLGQTFTGEDLVQNILNMCCVVEEASFVKLL